MKRLLLFTLLVYFCGMAAITEARWVYRLKHLTEAGSGRERTIENTFVSNTAHPKRLHSNHYEDISSFASPLLSEAVDTVGVEKVKDKLEDDAFVVKDHYCSYHPAAVKQPRIVEQYDQRSVDGPYEYRYELSNGVTHYERAYRKPLGYGKELLARKGFYSYRLDHGNFITLYYTADENGFQQDPAKYTQTQPVLPKRLLVPGDVELTIMNDGKKPMK